LRILFLGIHFPRPNNPTIGVWALSQVSALREAGHEVRVICPIPAVPRLAAELWGGTAAACPPRHDWGGIETDYVRWLVFPVGPLAKSLRSRPAPFVKLAWQLSSRRFLTIARSFSPEIIFAHHAQFSGFIAARLARRLKTPYFISEHNFSDLESCANNLRRRQHYLETINGIGTWIAVAKRMRATMHDIFPGIPIATVPNGADAIPDEFLRRPRPPAIAQRVIVLCAAFFYKRKNVPLLIAAFDHIAHRHREALLLIIGDGEDQPAVAAAAGAAAQRSQIILLGTLPHSEVLQHMAWCDVFAHIGINEPYGVVFAEAMMAGKPIIYATDSGITDVVTHGVHGLGVEPDDRLSASMALDCLLGDAALRRQMGRSASELAASRLTWTYNAEIMIKMFQAALGHDPETRSSSATSRLAG
jgi:glycosyltransferase involved in cell wall biosynthesis